jgi:predicted DNA-binding protein
MKKAGPTEPKPRIPSIHFRISAEHYEYLQKIAKQMDRPVSYLIAQIVREWINKPKEPGKEGV